MVAWTKTPVGIHETGEIFATQKEIAIEFGISTTRICQILQGQAIDLRMEGLTIYRADELKQCSKCKKIKKVEDFSPRRYKDTDGAWLQRRRSNCKVCANKRRATYFQENKTHLRKKQRLSNVKAMYGLSNQDYLELVNLQKGRCACCSLVFKGTPHVDHNHETGKVRGLLCLKCNLILGMSNEDPHLLWKIREFILHHNKEDKTCQN